VKLAVPADDGVKFTLQLADGPVPLSGHEETLKAPGKPFALKVTPALGVVAPTADVSVTVAVQVEAWFTTTGLWQLTLVEVACGGIGVVDMSEKPEPVE
jgi:hypothetical protein